MQIILLRHGKPAIDSHQKLSASEFAHWVERYKQSSIDERDIPPDDAINIARQSDYIVCSDLPRSIASAQLLGVSKIDLSDRLFREFDMPYSNGQLLRLTASGWSAWYRLRWLLGYSSNAETYRAAKDRADHCLEKLIELAAMNQTVLFVGHGALNWYLSKQLRRQGWQAPKSSTRKYWSYVLFKGASKNP